MEFEWFLASTATYISRAWPTLALQYMTSLAGLGLETFKGWKCCKNYVTVYITAYSTGNTSWLACRLKVERKTLHWSWLTTDCESTFDMMRTRLEKMPSTFQVQCLYARNNIWLLWYAPDSLWDATQTASRTSFGKGLSLSGQRMKEDGKTWEQNLKGGGGWSPQRRIQKFSKWWKISFLYIDAIYAYRESST